MIHTKKCKYHSFETGEPREVHHFAVLLGYGVNAINPYLAYETLTDMAENKYFDKTADEAVNIYRNVVTSGIVKIMSKMGISTIQSYQGAQIFEALGVSESVVDKYFTGTVTRIGGIDINQIDKEAQLRHEKAFDPLKKVDALEAGGNYKWRKDGECHMFNPKSIYLLQRACREGDYKLYKEFAAMENDTSKQLFRIRGMLDIKTVEKPINIDEVESVESIVKRFKTGAMSYGSISKEAHECMAIAMNRLGGKSNSGEGGEEAERFTPDENGDLRRSAIKQVASGRFGVTIMLYGGLLFLLSLPYIAANSIAWVGAVSTAYVLNRRLVFHSRNKIWKELPSFAALRFLTLLVENVLLWLLIDHLYILPLPAKLLVSVITVVGNYVFCKYGVFKKGGKVYVTES